MAKQNSADVAAKWASRLSGSTAEITKGVQNVTVAPTMQAAAKQQKMLTNLTAAVNSGKWAAGLKKVSLQDWQTAIIQKGIPRISQGAQAAQPKFTAFMDKLIPYQESLKTQINSMPDLTIQDSANRMVAWMQGMSKFQK